MAICFVCNKQFDPEVEEEEYDNNSYIQENNLQGTFGNFINMCAEHAIEEAMSSYPQGMEDLGYLGDD